MGEAPEQKARREIDAELTAAGWAVQNREDLDLTAGRGIAVRNFTMKPGFGFADYLLYLDRKAAGAVEAKPEGTLTGVEAQSAKYAAGLPDNLPAHRRPLPFLFESNGSVTYFTNGLDPVPRSRVTSSIELILCAYRLVEKRDGRSSTILSDLREPHSPTAVDKKTTVAALSPPLGLPERSSSYCVGATRGGSAFENRT